jgi:hypothetical protein
MIRRPVRFLALLSFLAGSFLLTTHATAQSCTILSQPFAHALGGVFNDCDDRIPVAGFAYALGRSATSGTTNIVCEADGEETQGGTCSFPPGGGARGDGIIFINGNWSGPGVTGCPNPTGVRGVGRNVIIVRDNSGGGLVVTVGYEEGFGGYIVEFAQEYDPQGNVAPLDCRSADRSAPASECAKILTLNKSGDQVTTTATIEAQALLPRVFSDCDPDSIGMTIPDSPSCTEGAGTVFFGRGTVHSRVGMCDGSDQDLRRSSWTAETTDANGVASFTRSFPSDRCLFVGTGLFAITDGAEGAGIACAVAIDGSPCADADGDGFSNCAGADCDDTDPAIHPGAAERCNGLDDDCDLTPDENLGTSTCGLGVCTRTMENCVGGVPQSCIPGTPSPEACDALDNDCNGVTDDVDLDGDGFSACSTDCDDADPAIHPGAAERCNGLDDDCDSLIDDHAGLIDGDGDGYVGACDNCPVDYNPSQADTDQDGHGNSCDNCLAISNPGQEDLDADGRGDLCDNCPTESNQFQDDFDGDDVGDVCDNCLFDSNPLQEDLDDDLEGDICDLNDGLILITLRDTFFVEWQREAMFDSFNEYRGDLAVLRGQGLYTQDPSTVPLAIRNCGLTDAFVMDGADPGLDEAVFYLVTGVRNGVETDLGTNSSGDIRTNANPCP